MPLSLLLITGATGFIGSETVHQALEKGYRTRLTVRRPDQVDLLKERYADHVDQIEFVVMPTIDKAALLAALKDVECIIHLASPMPNSDGDLKTGFVEPAVSGTLAVLAAAEAAPSVKRVIITSSILSLIPLGAMDRPGQVTEEGANASLAVDLDAPVPPPPAGPVYKYHASKILAHRSTIDFAAARKPAFDVVSVHPYYVIGFDRTQKPGVPVTKPAGVNGLYLYSLQSEEPVLPSSYVDVRDVAAVHVNAVAVSADKLKPRGEVTEYIVNGPLITWDTVRQFVAEKFPRFPLKLVRSGNFAIPPTSSTERATRDLGITFHDPLETMAIMLAQHVV